MSGSVDDHSRDLAEKLEKAQKKTCKNCKHPDACWPEDETDCCADWEPENK